MDPNLFHLDWDRLFEVLAAVTVLAFFLERALALLFESRWFLARLDDKGVKELIAFLLAAFVCWYWHFDAVSMVILAERTSLPGSLVTAAVIAGGSKASIHLFQNILGVQSSASRAKKAAALQLHA
jgi:hypothetical protein